MNNLRIVLAFLLLGGQLIAQDTELILADIAKNNTQLSALHKEMDAEMLKNKTGVFLENPEFEFHYLWGSPEAMGQRTDISITQSFDFPTVYSHQGKIADIKNAQEELKYKREYAQLMLDARQKIYHLIYYNAVVAQIEERQKHALAISDSYKAKLQLGESNIIEYNKAQLNLININEELKLIQLEREALLSELKTLNGGEAITITRDYYELMNLPNEFEEWYSIAEEKNPSLNWLKKEIEHNLQNIKLMKAMSLPKLQAGFMSEKAGNEQFKGLVVGVSIPLWENKNTVKYAQANSEATVSISDHYKLEFYHSLSNLYSKAKKLQFATVQYKESLVSLNHSALLKKALVNGQITLIDYLQELTIFYDSQNRILQMERDYQLIYAELHQYM